MRRALAALLLLILAAPGCEDRSYRDIGGQINLLTSRTDNLVPPAVRKLAGFGRRALPQIEIALHTASPAGKRNLVQTIDTIGDPDGAAILRHFAVYDAAPEVRGACEAVLARWAGGSQAARAAAARAALAQVSAKRARGEGPVLLGDHMPRK